MRFGCHVSIRYGYLGAARQALKIGARAFQYFPKNPRSLRVKHHDRSDAAKCAAFSRKHGLVSIAHAPYPTNLSTETQQTAVIRSILNDLDIANDCGSIGVVVHFGTYKGDNPIEGYKRMIDVLNGVLSEWDGESMILLENNAGKGDGMGTTLEELVEIRKLTDRPEKIGFCFDTCHAFASGLWTGINWHEIEKRGEELGFFENLKAVHLNDSAFPSGSKRDRHANVGKGEIGENRMRELITSPLLKDLPMILETPSSETYSHRDEIAYLNRLAPNTEHFPD